MHSLIVPGAAWSLGLDHRRDTPPFFGPLDVAPETRHTAGWAGVHYRGAFPDLFGSAVVRVEQIEVKGGKEGSMWGPLLRLSLPVGPARVVGITNELEAGLWRGVFDYHELGARGSIVAQTGTLKVAALADAKMVGPAKSPPNEPESFVVYLAIAGVPEGKSHRPDPE